MGFFIFLPFLFLPHSLSLFYLNGYKTQNTSKHKNNFSHKPNEIKTIKVKKEKREKRETNLGCMLLAVEEDK